MTTPTATQRVTPARPAAPGRGALTGTGVLVRFALRRDRVRLPAWVGGIGLFALYLCTALPEAFPTQEDLLGGVALFADPVGRLMTGPGIGFDQPSIEQVAANGYGLYLLILAALMSILLVVRHTRVEEQTGRSELVRANVVGRHAPLTAALVLAAIANLVSGLVVVVVMVAVGGFAAAGSVLLGAAVSASGLAFAGVAAIAVQLTEYSRSATGMAGAVLGVAFVLRAAGDLAQPGGSALSWASPLGWAQQTGPFVLDRWWPLALVAALACVTAAGGYVLSTRRDVGASMVPSRLGRSRARASLGTPLGLALRLQRASILGWGAGLAAAGLVFGAFSQEMIDSVDTLPEAFFDLFSAEDFLASYLAYMAAFMTLLVAVFAVLSVLSLRSDETGRRTEPVLATPVGRPTWLLANLAVTAGGAVLIAAVSGAATGLGAAVATGDAAHVSALVLAQLNQVPAALVVLAVAVALFGVLPSAIPAAWALVGYALVAQTFGPMLDLPSGAGKLSPFEHVAAMPLESFDAAPVLVLAVLAAGIAALGVLGFRRRDVATV